MTPLVMQVDSLDAKFRSTIQVSRCTSCGHTALRSRLVCQACGSLDLESTTVPGKGLVIAVSQTSVGVFQVVELQSNFRVLVVGLSESPAVGSEIWIKASPVNGLYTAVLNVPQ